MEPQYADTPSDPKASVVPARRRVIKAAVAGTAAAVLWTEPTLKGLARRPAYASASSTALTVTRGANADTPVSGQVVDIAVASDGFSFIDFVFTDVGDGTYTVSAIAQTAGCSCVIDGVNASNITARDGDGNILQTTGQVVGGVLEYQLVPGAFIISANWSGLTVTCT